MKKLILSLFFNGCKCLLLVVFSLVFIGATYNISNSASHVVRVGFFPMNGFQEYDKYGKPYGYNVDYLSEITSQTGLEYVYVRTECWDSALQALDNGTIDLLGSAQITKDRLDRFTYSQYDAGFTYGAIIIPTANNTVAYEDFRQFSELKVGIVKTYARYEDFLEYAAKNNFTPNLVHYESTAKMRDAMRAGEINMMVASVMEISQDEKVAGRFASAPFYFITKKDNDKDFMANIDLAMSRIKLEKPYFEYNLFKKYYPSSSIILFTRNEMDFIKNAAPIRVGHLIDRNPISYFDNTSQKIAGISPDLVKWIEGDTGLVFEDVVIPQDVDPIDFLKNGKSDLAAGMISSHSDLKINSIVASLPYFTGTINFAGNKGTTFSPLSRLTVAVPNGINPVIKYIEAAYPRFGIIGCTTVNDCLDSVKEGRADLTVQNFYVLDEYLFMQRYKELAAVPNADFSEHLLIGMLDSTNPLLLSVLNKSISNISNDIENRVIINNTFANPYVPTLEDFFIEYKVPIAISITALILLACAGVMVYIQRKKHFELIAENEERLQIITNNINGGVLTITPDNKLMIEYANDGFLNLVGITDRRLLVGSGFSGIIDCKEDVFSLLQEKLASARQVSLELNVQHAKGQYIPVLLRGTLSKDEKGLPLLYCVVVDITEQKQIINKLTSEKERANMLIELSDSIFFDISLDDFKTSTSPMFIKKFGWDLPSGLIFAHYFEKRIHPEDISLNQIKEEIALHKRNSIFDIRVQRNDGKYIWCRFTLGYFYDGGKIARVIGKIEDIDEDVRRRQYLENTSSKDKLTGVLNRDAFQIRVDEYVEKLNKNSSICGVFYFIDLDNFKAVNDILGHQAGDTVLTDTIDVIKRIFRSEDIIARFGGDELMVFAPTMQPDIAGIKAEQLCNESRRTYIGADGETIDVSLSIGMSKFPEDGNSFSTLLQKADAALYKSKNKGKGSFSFYSED